MPEGWRVVGDRLGERLSASDVMGDQVAGGGTDARAVSREACREDGALGFRAVLKLSTARNGCFVTVRDAVVALGWQCVVIDRRPFQRWCGNRRSMGQCVLMNGDLMTM